MRDETFPECHPLVCPGLLTLSPEMIPAALALGPQSARYITSGFWESSLRKYTKTIKSFLSLTQQFSLVKISPEEIIQILRKSIVEICISA